MAKFLTPIPENYDKMIPISTYGASKLSCEAFISAYSYMFDIQATVFRFANVVGPLQTWGRIRLLKRLTGNPSELKIFGDGTQSKPYIHIDDILRAFRLMEEKNKDQYSVFNVGTTDFLTVREIADIVCSCMGLKNVKYLFTGGSRGWKADVPVYRLDSQKIRGMGWTHTKNSYEAVESSVQSMISDLKNGNVQFNKEV